MSNTGYVDQQNRATEELHPEARVIRTIDPASLPSHRHDLSLCIAILGIVLADMHEHLPRHLWGHLPAIFRGFAEILVKRIDDDEARRQCLLIHLDRFESLSEARARDKV